MEAEEIYHFNWLFVAGRTKVLFKLVLFSRQKRCIVWSGFLLLAEQFIFWAGSLLLFEEMYFWACSLLQADEMYCLALKSDDQMFHIALYDWLIHKNLSEKLLDVSTDREIDEPKDRQADK